MKDIFNHSEDFAPLAYTMIEKQSNLQYHLSGTGDWDTLTIDGDDNWELMYSSIDDLPYEVSYCYEKKIDDGTMGRKYCMEFNTAQEAIACLLDVTKRD